MIRSRFAPSPTGDLHLGSAFTALGAWVTARARGGAALLRVEDLDPPRVVRGAEASQRADLAWLGLDWDEVPLRQSERSFLYADALARLGAMSRTYPCDCSRAEVARAASAPHEGEELAYPGTCRDKDPRRAMKRPPALRLRVEASDAVAWTDQIRGPMSGNLLQAGGDFVLQRGDGVYAYQLAAAFDDMESRVTDVVRGDDLVGSTPRQLLLMHLWGASDVPRYAHLPLVRAQGGARLAKRTPGSTLRELRDAGVLPEEIVGTMAHKLGLLTRPEPVTPGELARVVGDTRLAPMTWVIPTSWSE